MVDLGTQTHTRWCGFRFSSFRLFVDFTWQKVAETQIQNDPLWRPLVMKKQLKAEAGETLVLETQETGNEV